MAQMQQLQSDFSCFADPSLKPGDGTITIGCVSWRCQRKSLSLWASCLRLINPHSPHLALNGHAAVQTNWLGSRTHACTPQGICMRVMIFSRGESGRGGVPSGDPPAARRRTYSSRSSPDILKLLPWFSRTHLDMRSNLCTLV